MQLASALDDGTTSSAASGDMGMIETLRANTAAAAAQEDVGTYEE